MPLVQVELSILEDLLCLRLLGLGIASITSVLERIEMAAVVGVLVMLYLYQLLCVATPVISPVNLSNKSLPINGHLHNNYTIKSYVSTLKPASFAVYEIAAKTTNMPGNSKRITSKRSTSTLAYFLCMSLLLTGGNIERNPGPVQQGHNPKLCIEKGLRICHLNIRSLVN